MTRAARCNIRMSSDDAKFHARGVLLSLVSRECQAAEGPMKRTWTIIGVADVPRSCTWYQSLLGLPEAAPAHDDFGQIVDADGTVLLCLHEWGAHGHPPLT